jgi:hypothetical protein
MAFNLTPIEQWEKETQKLIDELLASRLSILTDLIVKELPEKDCNLWFAMGTGDIRYLINVDTEISVCDYHSLPKRLQAEGEQGEKFLNALNQFQYNDNFETGICIPNITKINNLVTVGK